MGSDVESHTVFVRRDQAGGIVSVSLVADEEHAEGLAPDTLELQAFVGRLDGQSDPLARSDTDMSRVLEDLIEVLTQKDLMRFTDLPAAAQDKLLKRRAMRISLTSGLITEDDSLI